MLEIGTGWGGFLMQSKNDFHQLDSITISKEQFKYSTDLHKNNSNVNVIYDDYRNVTKRYNSIVSIEMFEAVGQEYWSTYFQKIYNLLSKNGKAVIQTITIDDKLLILIKTVQMQLELLFFREVCCPHLIYSLNTQKE